MKEFEWFEWFEWFGPSPIEPFNPGASCATDKWEQVYFRGEGYSYITGVKITSEMWNPGSAGTYESIFKAWSQNYRFATACANYCNCSHFGADGESYNNKKIYYMSAESDSTTSTRSGICDPGRAGVEVGDQQTSNGSFSAVSKPIFASRCSLESFRRDIQYLHAYLERKEPKLKIRE